MGSAQGSSGGAATTRPRSVGRAGAPRTVRTLVALLGVSCLTLTAAVADPAGPGAATALTAGVFAAGPGGLGALDTSAAGLPVDDRLVPPTASTPPGGGPVGVDDRVDPLLATVEIADLGIVGDEVLASVIPSALTGSIPAATLRAYRAAAEVLAREDPGCRVDWALLAAIGRIESSHGRFAGSVVGADGRSVPPILGVRLDGSLAGTMVIRDTDGGALDGDTAYDRALGPMQFLPGTWRGWGSDGDRDGRQDPQDIDDAALAAARYLCAGAGGLDRPGPAAAAVRRYNNSTEYVNRVLATAASYRVGGPGAFPDGAGSGWYGPTGDGPTGPSGSTSGDRTTRTPATTPTTATSPTPSPTSSPSPTPTTGPSVRPEPTSSPEPSPTGTPTPSATDSPTGEPTGTPTRQPTGEPTGQPTSEPTGQPTGEPTAGPSGEPTGEPSGEPTGGPAPTVSPDPTCETTSASDVEPAPTSCTTDACGTASGDDAAGGVTVEPSSADQPAATCEPAAPASPDPTG